MGQQGRLNRDEDEYIAKSNFQGIDDKYEQVHITRQGWFSIDDNDVQVVRTIVGLKGVQH